MNRKAELYRKCHIVLAELSKCNQKAFIEKEIENRLLSDGTIKKNGLDGAITSKGNELFQNKYYLELAEKAENEESERELRERDSLMNQISVEQTDEQIKINRQLLSYQKINIIISGIAAFGIIIGILKGCNW